jgi:hypothetical protein
MDLKQQVARLLAAHDEAKSDLDEPLVVPSVRSLGAQLAAMHLSDNVVAAAEQEFDDSVDGDNGLGLHAKPGTKASLSTLNLGDHITPLTDAEFDDFVDGDNGLGLYTKPNRGDESADPDLDASTRATLAWIDAKRALPTATTTKQPVQGFWADFKNALFSAYLVPASDASMRGRLAGPLLSPGMLNDLRPDTGHADRLVVETLGGRRRYDNNANAVRLLAGVPGAHVYPLAQGALGVARNDFFHTGSGTLESGGAKVTFTNPATNEPETWKLTFDAAQARALHQSTVWVTKGSDLMLVLRFANEGENPALREVVVLNGNSSSSSVAARLPKLNQAEVDLAEQVVRGQAFSTAGVSHDALGTDAENALRVLGRTLAALSSAYAPTIVDFGPPSATGAGALPTLKAFAVACHEQDMGDQDDEAGVAARRGDALAAHIQGALKGAPRGRVVAAMHALASAAAIAHMCYFRSHAASAEHKLAQFLQAKPEHRADKVSLHGMFFG